jgi:hypothetical protein
MKADITPIEGAFHLPGLFLLLRIYSGGCVFFSSKKKGIEKENLGR